MLTPRDIETKEFSKARVNGYKPEEVESFLDEILLDYQALFEEKEALNKRILNLTEKLEKSHEEQDHWKNAILTAQKSYDSIIENGKKKADKMVADAQEYAHKLVETCKTEADYQRKVISQTSAEVDAFKAQLFSIYEQHIKVITDIPSYNKENKAESVVNTYDILKSVINQPEDVKQKNIIETKYEADTVVISKIVVEDEKITDFDDDDVKSYKSDSNKKSVKEKIDFELLNSDDLDDDDDEYGDADQIDNIGNKESLLKDLFNTKETSNKKAISKEDQKKKNKSFINILEEDEDIDDDDDEDDEDDE